MFHFIQVGYIRFWLCFLVVFFSDQATKSWVVENSSKLFFHPIKVLGLLDGNENLLEITYVTNPGAAWSMLSDYPEFLTLLAGLALLAIYFFRSDLELKKIPQQIVFGLIAGGIAGNLGDRIFRNPAEVVDFIDFYLPVINYDYPVFNIADSAIFVGAFSYLLLGILESRKENKVENDSELNDSKN